MHVQESTLAVERENNFVTRTKTQDEELRAVLWMKTDGQVRSVPKWPAVMAALYIYMCIQDSYTYICILVF